MYVRDASDQRYPTLVRHTDHVIRQVRYRSRGPIKTWPASASSHLFVAVHELMCIQVGRPSVRLDTGACINKNK
jgi:hypothetical protein